MRLEGNVTINAAREKVYDFLIDAEAISVCVPGLDTLEVIEPKKKFHAQAQVGLGTVKVKFDVDMEWLELDPPNRAMMKGHGTAPGSAGDATAEITLVDGPEGSTEINWWADVTISGTIASLASRLMKPVSKKLTKTFFDCLAEQIEG